MLFLECCHSDLFQLGNKMRRVTCNSFEAQSSLLSLGNALRWGYSNAAVVPSVRGSIRLSMRGPCEHYRDYTVACFFVKLGSHVNHDERMNPLNLEIIGQRSRSQWTSMEISL